MTKQSDPSRILTLKGHRALSGFRREKLRDIMLEQGLVPANITSHYIHIAEVSRLWEQADTEQLARLLGHAPDLFTEQQSDDLFLVVPRIGTISPWSSKATDIAGLCGLDALIRLERGIAYRISGINHDQHAVVSTLLHDRMTETVLSDAGELYRLFMHHDPQPLVIIDILSGGREA